MIGDFWIRMDADRTSLAKNARERYSVWVAPRLWHTEFRNVLRSYMAGGYMSLSEALEYARLAEEDLQDNMHPAPTPRVLELVDETAHSAYDCEYVALARKLDVALVTGDETVAEQFPDTAVLLEDFAEE